MEQDQTQELKELKSEVYDLSKENSQLRQVIGAIAQHLKLKEQFTIDELMEAVSKTTIVEEVDAE